MKKFHLPSLFLMLAVGSFACSSAPEASQQEPEVRQATAFIPGNKVTTPSGLNYEVLAIGHGRRATPGKEVSVHYTGWLENGTQFDSSRNRGVPLTFTLGQGAVIQGWDEAVALMRVGDRLRLRIPARLAYGSDGKPPTIPPNAPLIFDVELVAAH